MHVSKDLHSKILEYVYFSLTFSFIIQKYAKIIISDNGIGISESDLPHIKDKFYKVDTNIRGTGIGLAVADEIIKMHLGEMNIYSEVSKGTTVEIILPGII